MTQPTDDLMLPPQAVLDTHIPTGVKLYGYTADAVREYAKKAVEAERAKRLAAPQPAQQEQRAQVEDHWMHQWALARSAEFALMREVAILKAAIRKTIDENGHLADGENCTLIDLKRAMGGGS